MSAPAKAGITVRGRPVPEMVLFDALTTSYMSDQGITAGIVGVMKNGQVVYLKGFGEDYNGNSLPENALVRLASCTKPFTAAAIRRLIEANAFTKDDNAFNLGQMGGGLLNYSPFPSLGDSDLNFVTVEDMLAHRGGWDRDIVADLTYREREIADDMGVTSPPGRGNTMRWILGQPLQHTPGSTYAYSNVGYLALGLIVESESGLGLISYLRQHVVTPQMWVPSTEIIQGRTFRDWQSSREPEYDDGASLARNVFDSTGPAYVSPPYGGWDHEARIGQGGLVISAPTALQLAESYHVGVGYSIGLPRDANPLTDNEVHNGALAGTNTILYQRTDGVNMFIFFNGRPSDGHFAEDLRIILRDALPSVNLDFGRTSDGFWVTPVAPPFPIGNGSYNTPYQGFNNAQAYVADGTRIRLKPGTSNWTGTISKYVQIDAPEGAVTIGQ
jgi:hypothetical protein